MDSDWSGKDAPRYHLGNLVGTGLLALVASAIMLIIGLRTSLTGSAAAISTAGAALYASRYLG
jgi:hypothetical protein